MINFEWDENKNKANFLKHGICFEFVQEIFFQPTVTLVDERRDYGEIREFSLGLIEGQIIFVVYTQRGDKIRIISARRANKKEKELYYEHIKRGTTKNPRTTKR